MAEALNKRIFHGARGKVFCNGKLFAHVQGVTWNRSFDAADFDEVGSDQTQAIVLMGQRVNASAEQVFVVDEDLYQQRVVPGGAVGDVIDWSEMSLDVYDDPTSKVLVSIGGMMPVGHGGSINARTLCIQNVSWRGRVLKHGSEL
jgi:hypothetical protein